MKWTRRGVLPYDDTGPVGFTHVVPAAVVKRRAWLTLDNSIGGDRFRLEMSEQRKRAEEAAMIS